MQQFDLESIRSSALKALDLPYVVPVHGTWLANITGRHRNRKECLTGPAEGEEVQFPKIAAFRILQGCQPYSLRSGLPFIFNLVGRGGAGPQKGVKAVDCAVESE